VSNLIMYPFTIAITDPVPFEIRCRDVGALALATLGWYVGRGCWGMA
jgi:hypothetical protein